MLFRGRWGVPRSRSGCTDHKSTRGAGVYGPISPAHLVVALVEICAWWERLFLLSLSALSSRFLGISDGFGTSEFRNGASWLFELKGWGEERRGEGREKEGKGKRKWYD